MVFAIKKPSCISFGRGYFLSDKSDKNTSLGIVPKTPYLLYSLKNYCILFHKNQTLITQTHLYFQKNTLLTGLSSKEGTYQNPSLFLL